MLSLSNLASGYEREGGALLNPLSLDVSAGRFICLLGRNGAGKSTLMRTMVGLQPALGGAAVLDGEDIAAMQPLRRARKIAVVLTERAFSPGLRVEDVVALGRQPFTAWHGGLSDDDWRSVGDALAAAGASVFRKRYVDDLSDGERQRVMIARALAQAAPLMVLDEITAFLDLPGRIEVMTLLKESARRSGAVVVLSSHDLDLSLQFADDIWLLDGAGGMAAGSPESLIGSGAIGRAFDTPQVRFSPLQRRFLSGTDWNSPPANVIE